METLSNTKTINKLKLSRFTYFATQNMVEIEYWDGYDDNGTFVPVSCKIVQLGTLASCTDLTLTEAQIIACLRTNGIVV